MEEDTNRTYEDHDVSKRHMTWWKRAWWIRIGDRSSMRSARGRRRIWRAARDRSNRLAAETGLARPSVKPKRQRERHGRSERRERQGRQCSENTIHIVLHLLANATANATAAATAAAGMGLSDRLSSCIAVTIDRSHRGNGQVSSMASLNLLGGVLVR